MAYIVIIFFCGLSAGTVAALLYRRERDVEKKACPECGAPVAIHDQVCMKCGHDIEWLFDDVATGAAG